jgi:hypothetical protein
MARSRSYFDQRIHFVSGQGVLGFQRGGYPLDGDAMTPCQPERETIQPVLVALHFFGAIDLA